MIGLNIKYSFLIIQQKYYFIWLKIQLIYIVIYTILYKKLIWKKEWWSPDFKKTNLFMDPRFHEFFNWGHRELNNLDLTLPPVSKRFSTFFVRLQQNTLYIYFYLRFKSKKKTNLFFIQMSNGFNHSHTRASSIRHVFLRNRIAIVASKDPCHRNSLLYSTTSGWL